MNEMGTESLLQQIATSNATTSGNPRGFDFNSAQGSTFQPFSMPSSSLPNTAFPTMAQAFAAAQNKGAKGSGTTMNMDGNVSMPAASHAELLRQLGSAGVPAGLLGGNLFADKLLHAARLLSTKEATGPMATPNQEMTASQKSAANAAMGLSMPNMMSMPGSMPSFLLNNNMANLPSLQSLQAAAAAQGFPVGISMAPSSLTLAASGAGSQPMSDDHDDATSSRRKKKGGRGTPITNEEASKKSKRLEKNKMAARECRRKKKLQVEQLRADKTGIEMQNKQLKLQLTEARGEVQRLTNMLNAYRATAMATVAMPNSSMANSFAAYQRAMMSASTSGGATQQQHHQQQQQQQQHPHQQPQQQQQQQQQQEQASTKLIDTLLARLQPTMQTGGLHSMAQSASTLQRMASGNSTASMLLPNGDSSSDFVAGGLPHLPNSAEGLDLNDVDDSEGSASDDTS